jgi:hypothetical protein
MAAPFRRYLTIYRSGDAHGDDVYAPLDDSSVEEARGRKKRYAGRIFFLWQKLSPRIWEETSACDLAGKALVPAA